MTKEELLVLHEVLDWTIPVASMRSHNIYVKAQEAMKIIVKELKEKEENKLFVVMRYPVLMEDEGRHFFIGTFSSKIVAEQWVSNQKDEYFKPSDYYILEKNK